MAAETRERSQLSPIRRLVSPTAVVLIVAVFAGVRSPLFSTEGLRRGWSSDAAVLGLMATGIATGSRFDFFFWGQRYLGPFTSILAAPIALALAPDNPAKHAPLALRLAASVEVLAAIVVFALAIRRVFGPIPALLATLVLGVAPPVLLRDSIAPIGFEMMLFWCGLLLWLAVPSATTGVPSGILSTPIGRFGFGALAGVGWWMHPGVIFVLLPLALVLAAASPWYARFRKNLRPRSRLLADAGALGWRPLSPVVRGIVVAANVALLLRAILSCLAFILGGLRWMTPLPWLLPSALVEALLLLVVVNVVLEVAQAPIRRNRPRPRPTPLLGWAPLAAGGLAGFAPVTLAKALGWLAPGYSFGVGVPPLASLVSAWSKLLEGDGSVRSLIARVVVLQAVLLLGWHAWSHRDGVVRLVRLAPGRHGGRGLFALVVLLNLGFFFVMAGGRMEQAHYTAPAWPLLLAGWGAAALALARGSAMRRILALASVAVVVGSAVWSGIRTTQHTLAEAGPGVLLDEIARAGCAVTYASYDQAYKLRFLSGERLSLVPWPGLDRNPDETRRLEQRTGRRCRVVGGAVEILDGASPIDAARSSPPPQTQTYEKHDRGERQ